MVSRALFVLGLAFVIVTAGCARKAPPSAPTPGPEVAEKDVQTPAGARKRIAVVPKGTVHEFWLTVKAGADDAGAKEGAEILWKGPSSEADVAGQITILESFIAQKVDGIVMAACDEKGLIPTVKKAMDAGIPVVTIDSGIAEDVADSFVATDNPKGASEAAKALAGLIGEKGTVGLIPFIAGAATSNMREKGFKDEISKHAGIKLGPVLYSQSDAGKGMQVTEDMLQSHPDLAGIFAANEAGAVGAARALEQRGVAGKVKLVAFDASEREIEALKKGTIQALVVQNPFRMGSEGVSTVLKKIRGEEVPKRIDTGVTVVTKANLNDPEIVKLLNPLGKK